MNNLSSENISFPNKNVRNDLKTIFLNKNINYTKEKQTKFLYTRNINLSKEEQSKNFYTRNMTNFKSNSKSPNNKNFEEFNLKKKRIVSNSPGFFKTYLKVQKNNEFDYNFNYYFDLPKKDLFINEKKKCEEEKENIKNQIDKIANPSKYFNERRNSNSKNISEDRKINSYRKDKTKNLIENTINRKIFEKNNAEVKEQFSKKKNNNFSYSSKVLNKQPRSLTNLDENKNKNNNINNINNNIINDNNNDNINNYKFILPKLTENRFIVKTKPPGKSKSPRPYNNFAANSPKSPESPEKNEKLNKSSAIDKEITNFLNEDIPKEKIKNINNKIKHFSKIICHYKTIDGARNKQTKVNQDSIIACPNLIPYLDCHFYAVCDGHELLEKYIIQESTIEQAINKSCEETNKKILTSGINVDLSGSTCIGLIIISDSYWCFNVGDSRCILICSDKQDKRFSYLSLSKDHKPSDLSEELRIKSYGGRIESSKNVFKEKIGPKRVWLKDFDLPGLAMTRSFGDRIGISAGITAEPEITTGKIYDNFICFILASDGIWEVMNSQQVCNYIEKNIEKVDIKNCTENLCDSARYHWENETTTIDDITCLLIHFSDGS